MNFDQLPRRDLLGVLGWMVPALLVPRGAAASPQATPTTPATPPPAPVSLPPQDAFQAPAPSMLVGLAAGVYRVTEVSEIYQGAFSLQLTGPGGDTFFVEVCALDEQPGAQRGPARTHHLELFVRNEGHGNAHTHEGRGLAAMALARELQHYEHVVPVGRLLPLRERQRRYREHLYAASLR
ncbi:MAG: hypothetical protein RMJ98_13610 [Myxococcales bacterium]|nr:hypothetical protein [Polyangiaceae bacterium]MDW8250327.1 hypothetical protein [Myxococcales bacterium]